MLRQGLLLFFHNIKGDSECAIMPDSNLSG